MLARLLHYTLKWEMQQLSVEGQLLLVQDHLPLEGLKSAVEEPWSERKRKREREGKRERRERERITLKARFGSMWISPFFSNRHRLTLRLQVSQQFSVHWSLVLSAIFLATAPVASLSLSLSLSLGLCVPGCPKERKKGIEKSPSVSSLSSPPAWPQGSLFSRKRVGKEKERKKERERERESRPLNTCR